MQENPAFSPNPGTGSFWRSSCFSSCSGSGFGALAGMLDARAASVRAEMDEAARLKSEAEAMLKEAEAAGPRR